MAIAKLSDVDQQLKRIERELGLLRKQDRLLYDRINNVTGAGGQTFSVSGAATGYIYADDGVIGGGVFPGSVHLDVDLHTTWSGMEFDSSQLRIDLDATFNAWTGVHTHAANIVLDDNWGDSPHLSMVSASNDDESSLYLEDSGIAGYSNTIIKLAGNTTWAKFRVDSSDGLVAAMTVDATGNEAIAGDLYFATTNKGVTHVDGVTDGLYLRFNGTRAVPAAIQLADLPEGIAGNTPDPTGQGSILISDATPEWVEAPHPGAAYRHLETNASSISWVSDITLTSGDWIGLGASAARLEFYTSAFNALQLYSSMDLELYSDAGTTIKGYWNGSTGSILLNETANTKLATCGITINVDSSVGEAVSLKGSGVAHGVTVWAETDTFFCLQQHTTLIGGIREIGFTESETAISLDGVYTTDDAGKTTAADGPIELRVIKANGTTVQAPGANANLVVIKNVNNARWLVDEDGDIHYYGSDDGAISDKYNDIELLTGLRALQSPAGSPVHKVYHETFRSFLGDVEQILVERGVLGAPRKDGGLVSQVGITGLIIDTLRKFNDRMILYERALLSLGVNPAMLEKDNARSN